ncbi:nucleotidyltransferase family protein [Hippea maritima]|uniref:DNA polymerase beta domain protein region n=1 Tax=Hippea maritima (strain ATCC 700847 / DSM 10411 / MH2) TaxID=760142 RepID=F2LWS2_HIPMA|nr:nucleotidyltransferase domain-containing protein [Hippea maritima]AEA33050.1 DNA polymerase beta domain protein region [Hippea maritima DSM 10411]
MNRSIIEKLRELKPILKERYGIEEFAVFGSVARGTDTENSDVDIVILKDSKKDFFLLMEAKKFLEDTLKKE